MQLVQLEAFRKEIADFPVESKEDILSLVSRFLNGEHLNRKDFKSFKIDKNTRIQEFRVKDHRATGELIRRSFEENTSFSFMRSTRSPRSCKKRIKTSFVPGLGGLNYED